jgi:hypothetical protein
VIDVLPALDLAPAAGEQMAVPAGRVLAQLVGVRDFHVEPLDPDLFVVTHAAQGSRPPSVDPVEP